MGRIRLPSAVLYGALIVLLGGALAACGAPAQTGAEPSSAAVADSTAASEAPVASAEAAASAPSAAASGATSTDASAETVVITHPQGEATVAKNPETVVVFDYSALDTLDQLGVPVAAVPQSNLPPFLEKYAGSDYANAGTLFEPDYELVNELQPDLIIVGGRSSSVYPELAEIAPTIDVTVDDANLLESFKASTTNLGRIFDKEDEVASRLADIEAAIARVNEAAAASGKKALILLTTGGKVSAYGPGSRFGMIHDLLGVAPVEEEISPETHGDSVSFEFIQQENPDILYIIDRDSAIGEEAQSAQQILDNDLVKATTAAQTDKMIYLDGATWYLASSGLGTMASMIGEVEASLK